MSTDSQSFDASILAAVVGPDQGTLSPPVAEAILQWRFQPDAVERMHELAEKNRRDALSIAERDELDAFLRVGRLLNLLHAQARASIAGG